MAPKVSKADKNIAYDSKICQLLDEYTQVLVAAADNVGSNQLQSIRRGLRGDSMVLMGKNTMMKRSIRIHAEKTGNSAILNLITLLVGNVGLIFTKGDLKEVSEEVAKYKASVSVVRAIGDQWIVQWIGETILQYFNGSVVAKGEDKRWTDLYNYRNKQRILTHRELVILVCIGESLLASLAWQGLTNFVSQLL